MRVRGVLEGICQWDEHRDPIKLAPRFEDGRRIGQLDEPTFRHGEVECDKQHGSSPARHL